jgi:hypothetical protein
MESWLTYSLSVTYTTPCNHIRDTKYHHVIVIKSTYLVETTYHESIIALTILTKKVFRAISVARNVVDID